MDKKTDGPAFPTNGGVTYKGMTMLDYFAGEAMQLYTITDYEDAAKLCYDRAEAMLKEREKRK